jgi:murein DD-endopeptidase MepM/ murein hydrolase activator NlpD
MRLLTILLLSFICACSISNAGPFPAQMLVNVYQPPSPLKADDKYFLVYEIYLSNYMKSPAKINSFAVDGNNKKNLFTLKDLSNAVKAPNEKNTAALTFAPGESKVIYVWIPFENEASIPKTLSHHLGIASSFKDQAADFNMGDYSFDVSHTSPVIISAPLRGKNWLAGNAPSNTSDHRRTGMIINGKPYYAQRYAIDFVQVGDDGVTFTGDVHKNTSYHCYNQDLLAVADGTVVALSDNVPENIPNSGKIAVPLDEKNLPGNYVVIDIGNGHYAGYAHIIPGSFKVKLGDHVKRGEVIAKLGNSGNSSEPHLHFQVIDGKSFLKSNGIPYGFNHFFAHPSTLIDEDSGSLGIEISNEKFKEFSNQLVLENAVINFE